MSQHELMQLGGISIEMHTALLMILIALLTVAAWIDIKSRRIPNRLVLTGLLFSFGIQIFSGSGSFSAWGLGLLVGFGLLFPLYLVRAMGAGDVKLMAMVGAFLGPASAFGTVLMTLLAGGILAIAAALWNGALCRTLANVRFALTHSLTQAMQGNGAPIEVPPASAGNVAYAVAIAAGTFAHLLLERSGHALFV